MTIRAKRRLVKAIVKTIGLMVFMATMLYGCYISHTYQIKSTVVAIDDNVVTFEDTRGYLWEITTEGKTYEEGQMYNLTIDTNQTDMIVKDDYVTKIKEV